MKCKHEEIELGYYEDLYCRDCGKYVGDCVGAFDSGDPPPNRVLQAWWNEGCTEKCEV